MTEFSPLQHQADALGAGLPPLLVTADHLAASVNLGVHGRRKAGLGESFWQFRRYGPADSAHRIDWRQSARSQHLYVREREWDVAETVWLWRDGGDGMTFGSGGITKKDRADLLLLALASLLVRGGERVALLGSGQRPAASKAALSRIAQGLESAAGDAPPDVPLARGSELVWLGDFLDENCVGVMRRLAQAGVKGHLVRIVDPAEEDFPFTGRARFQARQDSQDVLFGRAEIIAPAYRARFAAHGAAVAAEAGRLGWSCTSHRIDRPALSALVALHAAIGASE